MAVREVLVLALTVMRSGLCTAGFCSRPERPADLEWVRPVKDHGTLQRGDLCDAEGRLIQCGDVVELEFLRPLPEGPHVEDWLVDWIYRRPRIVRRLEGERRARLLANYVDCDPSEVMVRHSRSLCLVHPDALWARFSLDPHTARYEARMGFHVPDVERSVSDSPRGVTVTDVKWRALGRSWLGQAGGELYLSRRQLQERIGAEDFYLALGLSRSYKGDFWLLVVGVHAVPDYQVALDVNLL